MTPRIEVSDLHLSYGSTTALSGISFELAGGKIYGLLGRNGSGKTSLLSVLAGFRRPTSGTVRVDGQPVFENGAVTSRICLIRETPDAADKDSNVSDSLEMARYLRPSWDDKYADELIERFEIPRKIHAGQLSRGKRSALGIVFGLASRTPVTLLDESYLGLDAPSRALFQELLLDDFMAHPRTIIVSTHLIEEMASIFEEVLIIDRGRLLLHEETDALRARGVTVTGPADAVDRFTAATGLTRLGERRLGRTKAVTAYGTLDADHRRQAGADGLDVDPVALQDLFIHLTEPKPELSKETR